ncbi:cytochrome-c oxidase [Bacillus thermotolerans]|uniref:cytochrome-c oxidase n=1 Tax=Bacillus thermotolerans TaxID=1221996 RepID=UPI000580A787|nr:cytochrome-c oxidase [Bacillus thermotolerans]KKB36180.1 hypothetical protein QY97_01272 [Bacillus thermotolerans]KKB44088.1 hypothetical protein QY96_03714 [Bacillus thermotolerans]
MGIWLIRIGAIYFGIGVLLGYYMSVTHNPALAGVHAHVNLLGWAALMIAGILYYLFPALASNGWAKAHVWLHNIGLPLMMIFLALNLTTGNPAFGPWIAIGATLTVLGILAFVINILANLKPKR